MADAKLSGPDEKLFYQSRRLYRKCCNIYYIQVSMMVKKFKKLLLEFIVAVMLSLSIPGMAMAADAGVPGAMCQSAGVWQGLIKNICWSCIFPMRIMGIGAAPGALYNFYNLHRLKEAQLPTYFRYAVLICAVATRT